MWNFIRIAARCHIGSGIISKNIGRSKGWVARLDTKNPLCVWPKHRPAENQIDSVCYIYVSNDSQLSNSKSWLGCWLVLSNLRSRTQTYVYSCEILKLQSLQTQRSWNPIGNVVQWTHYPTGNARAHTHTQTWHKHADRRREKRKRTTWWCHMQIGWRNDVIKTHNDKQL